MEDLIVSQQGLYLPMLAAGFSVMSGVSLKNTGLKLWGQDMKVPGMILFVGGWFLAIVAFYMRYRDHPNLFDARFVALPVLGIVVAAISMNAMMAAGEEVLFFLPILFVLSWLAFVGMISMASGTIYPFAAAFLVFASMMWLIPMERAAGVADGIGMVLFYIAFLLLASAMTTTSRI